MYVCARSVDRSLTLRRAALCATRIPNYTKHTKLTLYRPFRI